MPGPEPIHCLAETVVKVLAIVEVSNLGASQARFAPALKRANRPARSNRFAFKCFTGDSTGRLLFDQGFEFGNTGAALGAAGQPRTQCLDAGIAGADRLDDRFPADLVTTAYGRPGIGLADIAAGQQAVVAHSGVAAWLNTPDGSTQVALFFLPDPNTSEPAPNTEPDIQVHEIYAVDNHDPFSGANVIARGIVGDIKGEPVVASPLYKQHFRLADGRCVEKPEAGLRHWPVKFDGDRVMVAIASGGIGPH